MYVDYHTHPLGHGGGRYTEEELSSFLSSARAQRICEIGFSDHEEFLTGVDETSIAAVRRRFPSLKVRLGLEISYRPGREREIAEIAARHRFDYLIGSVHDLDAWMFDHPAYEMVYRVWDADELYRKYFLVLEKLAMSGLFDIVGHLDVIKVFGYRPAGRIADYAERAIRAVQKANLTVEVNTAGLRKPCSEIYPSRELLERCYELDIPVTVGSDAHTAGDVGRDFAKAYELLFRVGYRKIAVFSQRVRSLISI
ncbi:histidinol-phosphatase HisJ family protein [Thermacetogenium phaeum]|jgi:histidinol-phosphatase (PHP family)|nr:histidinol-phosphatase HisJ family protein [Thermacetogenium phaeum]KUK36898.1 MAG: Histidinol phosphate phosphatase HisJ [Thermacetogenium phaeum]MDN5365435.1 histidinol-phosphatase family [Thermacetogenium sp.]